jgi:hypothetical protein
MASNSKKWTKVLLSMGKKWPNSKRVLSSGTSASINFLLLEKKVW